MIIRKIILNKIRKHLNESLEGDAMRLRLNKEFSDEISKNQIILTQQNKAHYEIFLFLKKIGLYDSEYDYYGNNLKKNDFKPRPTNFVGSFSLVDFIKLYKKYLSEKYKVSAYSNSLDEIWDKDIENNIKPNVEKILKDNGFELKDKDYFLYGNGDLSIKLKVSDEFFHSTRIPDMFMKNPGTVMTSKEFFGIEDRKEKRKFIRYVIDGYEYKFLTNPINQDKHFSSGDKSVFGQLFGGNLDNFLKIEKLTFETVILQIHKDYKNYNFIIGGNDFYLLEDVLEFKKNEDFDIKKLKTGSIFYKKLVDLKDLYTRLNSKDIKMIVFLDLGGDLIQTKDGGLVDRNKTIYYPYIIKK